jgi:cation diffusion facilitator family transporter
MTISNEGRAELVFAAKFSVYSNSILVVLKLIVGIFTLSVSVISEAIHSGTDLLAALIANFSVRKSTKPADDSHSFGHGKYESLSGTLEAILILIAAGIIIIEAALKLLDPTTGLHIVEAGIIVMGISAAMNFTISRYLMKVAKKHKSLALEADALHLRTDVWTSVGVFVGLIAVWVTGYNWIDPAIAIIVAMIIINAALMLTRRSTFELLDHSLSAEEEAAIRETIKVTTGENNNYHGLRTRRSGRESFIDFHLVLPRNLPIEKAHEMCDEIERRVVERLPNSNLTIHVEPCDGNCDNCQCSELCKSLT